MRYSNYVGWILVSFFLVLSFQSKANETSFEGGVFSRPVGEPMEPVIVERSERPAVIFDDTDDTNWLIVRLDLDNETVVQSIIGDAQLPENRARAEEAVVAALNSGNAQATQFFFGANHAWHLVGQHRLDDASREALNDQAAREILQQYIVLNYPSIESAREAKSQLVDKAGVLHAAIDKRMNFLWSPNDAYFSIVPANSAFYQWGMHIMNFPDAWDETRGHGYVGVIDTGLLNNQPPPDLEQNYRPQFSFVESDPTHPTVTMEFHGTHVMGIIAATADNTIGVAGGCPYCSAAMARTDRVVSDITSSISELVDRGLQVINLSLGGKSNCSASGWSLMCLAITAADDRDVLIVAAAGNDNTTNTDLPASHALVLSVGGIMNTNSANPNPFDWDPWEDDIGQWGTDFAGVDGIMAPAKSIVSTVPLGAEYNNEDAFRCSDLLPVDESGVDSDGYASCTGTSMAAPHISALAGILRSINPRLPHNEIQNIIRASGTHQASPTAQLGSGLAQADIAVNDAITQTTNRLTPLFSLYSSDRLDYFYTTVPQMAAAATWGTLRPVNTAGLTSGYQPDKGNAINGYSSFPGGHGSAPLSAVWVFTTPDNPQSATIPLAPLYRLSWKCGDATPYPPVICSTVPNHTDTVYTTDPSGVATFQSWGYQVDGIEGYIYPKTIPQPTGTVRLMRKYNVSRDDHAIFPETMLAEMATEGYTEDSGSDWLGYVYPNTNGNVPSI